jgi:entericidin A
MRTTAWLAVLALLSLVLSGCNTVAGFGEDLNHVGRSINNAASR